MCEKELALEINLGKVRLVCTQIMYNQRVQLSKSMPVCASLKSRGDDNIVCESYIQTLNIRAVFRNHGLLGN